MHLSMSRGIHGLRLHMGDSMSSLISRKQLPRDIEQLAEFAVLLARTNEYSNIRMSITPKVIIDITWSETGQNYTYWADHKTLDDLMKRMNAKDMQWGIVKEVV